jgi:hypothetical protein
MLAGRLEVEDRPGRESGVSGRSAAGRTALVLAALVLLAGRGGAEDVDSGTGARPGFLRRSVQGRLTVGLRGTHSWLVENRRAG